VATLPDLFAIAYIPAVVAAGIYYSRLARSQVVGYVIVAVGLSIPLIYVATAITSVKIACSRAGPALFPDKPFPTYRLYVSGFVTLSMYADSWPNTYDSNETRPRVFHDPNPPSLGFSLETRKATPLNDFLNTYRSETTISRNEDKQVVARREEFFWVGGKVANLLGFGTPFVGCSQTHPDLQAWQPRGLGGGMRTVPNLELNAAHSLLIPLQDHDEWLITRTVIAKQ
jgi:hypothetical protein